MLAAVVYLGTISFGGRPLTSSGTSSLALASFDSSGELNWAKSFGGAGSGFKVGSVGANAAGTVILTAGYVGTVNLGAGPLSPTAETVLAAFGSGGSLKWNTTVMVGAQGSLIAAAGSCGFMVATNSPSVTFGSGPLSTVQGSVASIGVAALGL